MKYLKAFLFYISLLIGVATSEATPIADLQSRPKLVLAVVVDQLRTDCLEQLASLMSNGGFARLKNEGTYFRNVQYAPARLDLVSSTAMLFSGATPDRTGVPSSLSWNASALKLLPTLSDSDVIGNFTTEAYSPKRFRLSTLADEVMIDGAGLGQAWAIAIDPQQAVSMAGHAGSGAVWLDKNTGRWCGSTYYKEMPQTVTDRNYRRPLSSRIDTMQWKPMLPLERYPGLPAQKRYYPFRHTFPSSAKDVYERFTASAKANTEVTDLAIDLLNSTKLGNRGDAIDMLCLGYTAAPFKYVKDGDYRLELADTYLRLDADLARLFSAADKAVGLDNTLIVLMSTGYYDDATIDDDKYRIPSGTFSTKRAVSLLNAFLTARHGQGNYISAWSAGTIWLNRQLLEKQNIALEQAAKEAKEFLSKMSGIEAVYTMSDLISSTSPTEEALRLSTDPQGGADLLVEIAPGWLLSEDIGYPVITKPIRHSIYPAPAFMRGVDVPAGRTLSDPVQATSLAPTAAGLLHIRQPNGTISAPVLFPTK
ncbi:MAG: alkaline phosphatase family protein [Prevotella sp.]|nr:alkaline phosphatase family protein [Prevotella sp.]MCM1075501.1 alkaline phosphatase family protein [Ruminococcus sp.]